VRLVAAVVGSLTMAACGAEHATTQQSSAAPDTSARKLLGNPDGSDGADRSCNVILRQAWVNQNRGGYETHCDSNNVCWIVMRGTIDISQVGNLEGDRPLVMSLSTSDNAWHTTPAVAMDGAPIGYSRWQYELDSNTSTLNGPNQTVQVIPYLQTGTGSRLFDHNRLPGAFDNYVLDPNAIWAIADDETTCGGTWPPGDATAVFSSGWTQQLQGTLVAGGTLNISYDLSRLPQCFGSDYNGLPAWDTLAYVVFHPGGPLLQRSVRGLQDPTTSAWASELFSLDVPGNATGVSMWFYTSGETCEPAWDSNYGQNYLFTIP
jgi:hypothetical protein